MSDEVLGQVLKLESSSKFDSTKPAPARLQKSPG